jgi:hypothetical protein
MSTTEESIMKMGDPGKWDNLTLAEVLLALKDLGAGSTNVAFKGNDGEPVLLVALGIGADAKRLQKVLAFLDDMAEVDEESKDGN